MTGAIIGDIIGSTYEFRNVKSKNFDLFPPGSHFTDDSILTVALMDCLRTGKAPRATLRHYARHYAYMPVWGKRFKEWAMLDDCKMPDSFGNGAGMRISADAWWYDNKQDAMAYAKSATVVSHNHPEAVKGAQAIVSAIHAARNKASKSDIKCMLEEETGYNLNLTLDEIRPTYRFDATCPGSVPQAIRSFLESNSFEDAIRNAISIGGDSDTIAAMTGSIAEAYYGTPYHLWSQACKFLDATLTCEVRDFLMVMHGRGNIDSRALDCLDYDQNTIPWL